MAVNIHFKVKAGTEAECESRLRQLGFDGVRVLPGGRRVLLSAGEQELTQRLGLVFEHQVREQAVGTARTMLQDAVLSDSSRLPAQIAELVDSCYAAITPDRLDTTR